MVTGNTFRCVVVTPESAVVDTQVTSVVFCTHDGLVGVLPGHAPLLSKLGTGIVRYRDVENDSGDEKSVFINGGVGHVRDNTLTLFCREAIKSGEVSLPEAEKSLQEAQELPKATAKQLEIRQSALDRAKGLIQLAKS